MNSKELSQYVDEYVAGTLDAETTRRVELAAERKPELRDLIEKARRLRREIDVLPASRQPDRDLWPGIEAALAKRSVTEVEPVVVTPDFGAQRPEPEASRDAGTGVPPLRVASFDWRRGARLAAAAMLLVVTSSGITAYLVRGTAPAEPSAAESERSSGAVQLRTVAWDEFRAVESTYEQVTRELLDALENRRAEMAPATLEDFDQKLADLSGALTLVNEAIDSMRAALERDPSNAGLANKLTSTYRKRVMLLQDMTRL